MILIGYFLIKVQIYHKLLSYYCKDNKNPCNRDKYNKKISLQ